jgi:ribokinase
MAVYNLGSINIDHIYTMPHLVGPGETLAATSYASALGGKGANQSVAIARAGGVVHHAGMIHSRDDGWLSSMVSAGVNIDHILRGDSPTGHAIVAVDDKTAENQIILAPLSNASLPEELITDFLADAGEGAWALTQNETNLTAPFLREAKSKGLNVCYSAAPFVAEITAALLPLVDLLIVNAVEAEDLSAHCGSPLKDLGIRHLIVTLGGEGARYIGSEGEFAVPAIPVKAVDTTGAGDTYLGYVLAGIDGGASIADAMKTASHAAAVQVTRPGASAAIPFREELQLDFS